MSICSSCGQSLDPQARFCSNCGQAQANISPTPPESSALVSTPRGCWKPLLGIFLALALLALMFFGGVFGFVFYKLKESEPAKLAVQSLRQSTEARQALGEIQKTGWPIGSFSVEGGGSGEASFSMSVRGSKAKGKYFATLRRENNIWRLQSSRLQLSDGRSLDLGSGVSSEGNGSSGGPAPPAAPESGGEQLTGVPNAVAEWREVEWPERGVTLKVPGAWTQERVTKDEVSFRNSERTAYFFGHVSFFNQKIPFEPILQSLTQSAAVQFRRRDLLGYTRRDFGKAVGVQKIERRGDGATMVSWEGYIDTADSGTASFSFVGGAPTEADFHNAVPVLGAILDSIQFK